MAALFRQDLELDTYADFWVCFQVLTGSSAAAMLDLAQGAATAVLAIRATPSDATPLVQVSTTATSSGSLQLGVALPAPAGASAVNEASLEAILAQGTPLLASTAPGPVTIVAASVAALEAVGSTSLAEGTIAEVTSGTGAFYAFSPSSTLTPNGTTIVHATDGGGNWLLVGTVVVAIAQAAMGNLVGTSGAAYDLLVTWPNGTTMKLLEGYVTVEQSNAGH
jgi:hypothetical protein